MGVNLTRFEFSRFSLDFKPKPSSFSASGHFDWLKKLTLWNPKTNKTNLIALHCDFPRSAPAEFSSLKISLAQLTEWVSSDWLIDSGHSV